MAKPKKTPKAPKPPRELTKVAEQIGELAEAAALAEDLEVENSDLKNDLHEAHALAEKRAQEALAYATEAEGVTEQDLRNLAQIGAVVRFQHRFASGEHYVSIEGTGRRRVRTRGATLAEALADLRKLMPGVPE